MHLLPRWISARLPWHLFSMPATSDPLVDTLCGEMPDLLRESRPQKRSARPGPLHQVKCGSVSIPIYRCATGPLTRYFICYYQGGRRIRRGFSHLDDAKREAQLAGRQIAAGLERATGLTLSEREAHDAAKKLLATTGVPLLCAVEEYVRSRELLGGHTVLAAVSDFAERHKGVRAGVLVPDLVPEFLASKRQDGASTRYLAQLKSDITRFAAAFTGPILEVRSHAIDDWLRALGCAPRTRNSIHTGVRTFFSWAKSRGYLPKNESTEAESLSKVKAGETTTGIFTPSQMRLLLDSAPPKMIPFLALGAFAGLRAAEMARIDWSAIDLDRRLITIRADQAKTASRRLVPISNNLAAWLAPHTQRGRVLPSADMQKKAGALAKVLGIEWPANGLRHSFITYRIAEIQSADQVALEAGNSPAILFKHYRELASATQAAEWFGIFPRPAVLSAS